MNRNHSSMPSILSARKPGTTYGRVVSALVLCSMLLQQFFMGYSTLAHAESVEAPPQVSAGDDDDLPLPNPSPDLFDAKFPSASTSLDELMSIASSKSGRAEKAHSKTSRKACFGDDANDHSSVTNGGSANTGTTKNPNQAKPCAPCAGDPVEIASGEFIQTDTDLFIPSRGIPIEIARTYRSKQQQPGVLGYNWFFQYESRIMKTESGNYAVLEMGGRREEYVKSGSVYISPERHFDTLAVQGDGSVKITKKDKSYLLYDVSGNLSVLADAFGNTLNFGYDSRGKLPLNGKSDFFRTQTSGLIAMVHRLTTITDSYGRIVNLAYYDDTAGLKSGRIQSVTDFMGRQVVYDYDDNGDLISVRSPVTSDYPAGKTTRYTYSTGKSDARLNHNLLTITDAKGQVFLTNEYDETNSISNLQDRVVKQTFGTGFFIFNYTSLYTNADGVTVDGLTKTATVTDRNGNITQYEVNKAGQYTKITQQTNRNIRPGEGDYVTQFIYDTQNQLVKQINARQVTTGNPNGTTYIYDSVGNVTSIRNKINVNAVDSVSDLVTYFEYEPLFNQVKRTVDPVGNVWISIFDYEEAHKLSPPLTGTATWVYNAANPGLGDVNADGATSQSFGFIVSRKLLGANDGANDTNAANDGVTKGPAPFTLQTIQTRFAYNNLGQVLYSIDPQGIKTSYEYYPQNDPDGDGLNINTVAPNNVTTPNGYLKKVTVDSGTGTLNLAQQLFYDRVGNVIGITNPRGFKTTFAVNALNQVTSVQSPTVLVNGVNVIYEIQMNYDENNNILSKRVKNIDDLGVLSATFPWIETSYSYDILDHVSTVVEDVGPDPANGGALVRRTTQLFYDNNENVIQITKPEGNIVQYVYDERDLIYKVVNDPNLGQPSPVIATTISNYDANGNLTQVTNPNNHSVGFIYDGFDRPTQTTDVLGTKALRVYDANSNVKSAEVQNSTSATFARTEMLYDEMDRAYQKSRWISGATNIASNYIVSSALYDQNSRVTKATDDNQRSVTMAYDNAHRMTQATDHLGNVSKTKYDANSNVIETETSELQPGVSPAPTFKRTIAYDSVDRAISVRDQGADGIYNNADDRISTANYDSRGNATRAIDAKGTVLKVIVDLLGRRTEVQRDPAGLNIVTRLEYDKNSRLTKYIGIRNNADAAAQFHETTYEYDRLDRLVRTLYADGKDTRTTYDANGNALTATDQNGSVATMTYDNLERVTSATIVRAAGVTGSTSRTYGYDVLSRMTSATDNNDPANAADDTEVAWSYDGLSRGLTDTQKFGSATITVNKSVAYAFSSGTDRLNLGKITYSDNSTISFGRDVLNRVTDIYNASTAANKLASFTYAGFGRTLTRGHFNGAPSPTALGTVAVGFDGLKRAKSIYNRLQGGAELASFDYGFDKADNRVYAKFLHAGGTGEIYRYDKGYRATEAYYGASAGDITSAVSTVAAGNDPAAPSAYASKGVYTLDDLGNRSSVLTSGTNGASPATTTYTSNQLAGATDYKMNRYTQVGTAATVHDSNGNLLDDATFVYGYDCFNRITTVTRKSDGLAIGSYKYDALNRRVRKTVSNSGTLNGTTHFIYQGNAVLEEYSVANPGTGETLTQSARYVNGRMMDERICVDMKDVKDVNANGNTTEILRFYYYVDALGSTRAVTWLNANLEVLVERIDYDIYGKPTFTSAASVTASTSFSGNTFLFTGQRLDQETGNYYYKMRYYSPTSGRFLSQDPLGYFDGANRYAYVGNNPLNFVDSMGLAKGGTKGGGGEEAGGKGAADPWTPSVGDYLEHYAVGYFDWLLDKNASFAQGFGDTICFDISSNTQKLLDYYEVPVIGQGGYRMDETYNTLGKGAGHVYNLVSAATGVGAAKSGLSGGVSLLRAEQAGTGLLSIVGVNNTLAVTNTAAVVYGGTQIALSGGSSAYEFYQNQKSKSTDHHLLTVTNKKSTASGGPYTPKFEEICKKAGMPKGYMDKLTQSILGHRGPHPAANEWTHNYLQNKLTGLKPYSDKYKQAFLEAIDEIRELSKTPGTDLNKLLTGK